MTKTVFFLSSINARFLGRIFCAKLFKYSSNSENYGGSSEE